MENSGEEVLDIVSLIETNPIGKLSEDYNSKLLVKIKSEFTSDQQKLFISSFYCYLNYDTSRDFVIDLSKIWKWCGFSRIDPAKRLIINNFIEDKDFQVKISLHQTVEQVSVHEGQNKEQISFPPNGGKPQCQHKEQISFPANGGKPQGGRPSEQILMTVNTFKKFCMKARTSKADEVHDYFIKLEKIMFDTVCEEAEELMGKLRINTIEMEKNIITNSNNNKLVYLGLVEDDVVKFGFSKDILKRVMYSHKKDFPNFVLKYTIHTEYYIELEEAIKSACSADSESVLRNRRIQRKYNDKNQTELIQLDDDLTVEDVYKEVLNLNQIILDKYKLGDNKTILKLKKELKEVNDENKKLKKQLEELGVSVNKEKSANDSIVEINDGIIYKYFLKFLEYFMQDKKDGYQIWMTGPDFYNLYESYIKEKYDIIFLMTYGNFNNKVLKCPSVTGVRKTLPKTHKDYQPGKDNRVKGKQITFNEIMTNWINGQLVL